MAYIIFAIIAFMAVSVAAAVNVAFFSRFANVEVVWTGRTDHQNRMVYSLRYKHAPRVLAGDIVKTSLQLASLAIGAIVLVGTIAVLIDSGQGGLVMATTPSLPLNLEAIKKLLGWREKLTGDRPTLKLVEITYNTYVTESGKLVTRKLRDGAKTTIVVEGSHATQFKMRPEILKLCVPKHKISLQVAGKFMGLSDPLSLLDEEGRLCRRARKYLVEVKGGYKFKQPHMWSLSVLARIATAAFKATEGLKIRDYILTEDDIYPAHPKHAAGNGKYELYILIKKRGYGARNFDQYCDVIGLPDDKEVRNSIFIRAGKDIWGVPLTRLVETAKGLFKVEQVKKKVLKFKVMDFKEGEEGGASHDGNVFLIADSGQPSMKCQFRGAVMEINPETNAPIKARTDNGFCQMKGDAFTFTDGKLHHPDTGELITDCQGITSLDNMKWLMPTHKWKEGDTLHVLVTFTKDEESKDRGVYSFNLLGLFIGKWSEKTMNFLMKQFKEAYRKTAKRMANPQKGLMTFIKELLTDKVGKDGLAICEKLAKYIFGVATADEIHMLWKRILKSAGSVKLPGLYVNVIFAEEWMGVKIKRGQFLASKEVEEKLSSRFRFWDESKPVTIVRQPVISHQNYCSMKYQGHAWYLPGKTIIMNPADAAHIQGDGDDHVTVFPYLESLFIPGTEEPVMAREKSNLGYKYSRFYFYFKGMKMQKSIGPTFNKLLQLVANYKDRCKDAGPIYSIFGVALDLFAQGIKKNVNVPDYYELKQIRDEWLSYDPYKFGMTEIMDGTLGKYSQMAEIYLGDKNPMEIAAMVKNVWDVDLPVSLPDVKFHAKRRFDNISENGRKWVEAAVAKTSFTVGKRDRQREISLNSPVSWIIWFQNQLCSKLNCNLQQMKEQVIIGNEAWDTIMCKFLDAYGYAAFHIAHKYMYNGHIGDKEFNTLIVSRLEHMNGLFILASQLVDHDSFDGPDDDGMDEATERELAEPILDDHPVVDTAKAQIVEPDVQMNIWFGSNENSHLSNLAKRPFTHDGRQYVSVEQAYQCNKGGKFDEACYNKPWRAGSKFVGGAQVDKSGSHTLMKLLISESFSQNPEAAKRLLDSGDTILTHNQDKGYWNKAFPEILMEVRKELKA